ncbi:hypothetical protein [Flexivirga meconopsidis]|uniref:hypothetical protein n=1 Tax=Flexivirga meconopsidis TaxID=2977121 RepID=UPI00223FA448|nr:hypothetical protein [Flexivirga meconopsidis]
MTWSYFGMLLGRPDVKADTWVVRYVRHQLRDDRLSPSGVRQLVVAAADKMGLNPTHLDHAIWSYARSHPRDI